MGHTGKKCSVCQRQIKKEEPHGRFIIDQKMPSEYVHLECSNMKEANKMDECCMEFCKKLDEWIQDEEMATKEYHSWSKKAEKKEPFVSVILETLSMDENKHGQALTQIAMLVCKNEK